jgi:hypothetical protein
MSPELCVTTPPSPVPPGRPLSSGDSVLFAIISPPLSPLVITIGNEHDRLHFLFSPEFDELLLSIKVLVTVHWFSSLLFELDIEEVVCDEEFLLSSNNNRLDSESLLRIGNRSLSLSNVLASSNEILLPDASL